jgi:biopolymer transport protein TolR
MAFSTGRQNRTAMADINVTPLVDVMLVLLIIFMVTAPMLQEGVTVELPKVPGAPLPQDQTRTDIIISVDSKGAIYLDDAEVQEKELIERIVAKTRENPKQDVYLKADSGVAYGTVVRVMAALRGAGITNLGMITNPADEAAQGK